MNTYRLQKSKHLFLHGLKRYKQTLGNLSEDNRKYLNKLLTDLQHALIKKDRKQASLYAHQLKPHLISTLRKKLFHRIKDSCIGLIIALVFAIIIRSLWFEPYEIPTGSMRPTLAESDRLLVSKTAYGINIPMTTDHIMFHNDDIHRNQTAVFTSANLDLPNTDMLYFYLFPGKKQFVKRLIGKPQDTLYFYGGKVYGIDKDGNDISSMLNPPCLNKIDHIPFITLNGKITLSQHAIQGIHTPVILKQMNQEVASLSARPPYQIEGQLIPPYNTLFNDYYDLWGFNDYGVTRLLTRDQISTCTHTSISTLPPAPLYLEIIHHPSIKHPVITKDPMGRLIPSVGTSSSILPLSKHHLEELMKTLYTARFIVKDNIAYRYGSKPSTYSPRLSGIPNGTYEFYYGKGYQVFIGGIKKPLPTTHPLYHITDTDLIQTLFNLGIEWIDLYAPLTKNQYLLPSRYAYFRDGDLYVMGGILMKAHESDLKAFLLSEEQRRKTAPLYRPHIPFKDPGPPILKDGTVDKDRIKTYGIKIPIKSYMALGDNYAMSSDSRDFGWVPADNLRGTPSYILWPPQSIGKVLQPAMPLITSTRIIIWILVAIGFTIYFLIKRHEHRLPKDIP